MKNKHTMKKLLSLPPNVAGCFHTISRHSRDEYYCTSDPVGEKLGSGGGTAWLLQSCHEAEAPETDFFRWLQQEKRILLHAGGQSRRLPAYAALGKVLTPIPVFRWARGQRIDQTLLDLQIPLYEQIMRQAPASSRLLIASGDVYIRTTEPLQDIPEADVVCYGLWADPALAAGHGVFFMNREQPESLDFMLQKPTAAEQARLLPTHFSLMDIGVWILSERAVRKLMEKSYPAGTFASSGSEAVLHPQFYDLYSTFGCALGAHPSTPDPELADLSVAILPLPGGEFYHFGTTPELLSSSVAIQNLVKDQRYIIQKSVKQQPSVFTQNAVLEGCLTAENRDVWVENAHLGNDWKLSCKNVVTGVPQGKWDIELPEGVCVDIVPVGESGYVVRPYGYDDAFRGDVADSRTQYLGRPLSDWLMERGLDATFFSGDIQSAKLFPVLPDVPAMAEWLRWMIAAQPEPKAGAYASLPRLSADDIAAQANLSRLAAQRSSLQCAVLPMLARNWQKSVFYQVNLRDMSERFEANGLELPPALPDTAPLLTRIHDAMFRGEAERAFSLLSEGLTASVCRHKVLPRKTTCDDQIVWGRSPVRIDLAGGWTDTPPHCLVAGGNVVNVAVELGGQQPLQVYVKPCREPHIVCRSIDLGAMEVIDSFEELAAYNKVGSPFSIPKAALALAGFLPVFCVERFASLHQQLQAFGCGIEITLLSAVPAGSGLGTSSILAATVLGAVSDFCGMGWDKNEICHRTLVLEQLLTTGGGWQDQYGGVFPGLKLLQTEAGFDQNATVRWAADSVFTQPEMRPCHLLYYTGLTRTAKNILQEIVRGMFLNNTEHLALLGTMKQHAISLFEALSLGDIDLYGRLLRRTWEQNKALDHGTNPPLVEALCQRVDDWCLGYKLPGAGGGGFMYMLAKDAEAACHIRRHLQENPLSPTARFVEMRVSSTGLQVSRS